MHLPNNGRTAPLLINGTRTLVTVAGSRELAYWDLATGNRLGNPIPTAPWGLYRLMASPDGNWIAACGNYGPELFNSRTRESVFQVNHTNVVTDLAFSRDSRMMLSVSWDRTARLWSIPDGRRIGESLVHTENIAICALSGDSKVIATAQDDGLVRIWQRPVETLVVSSHKTWGQRPRLSFDGKLLAPGLWHEGPLGDGVMHNERLRVLRSTDGRPAGPPILTGGTLIESCVCGDNATVAAIYTRDNKAYLRTWNVKSGLPLFNPISLPKTPYCIAARPGSKHVAIICDGGGIPVYDCITGKQLLLAKFQGWGDDVKRAVQAAYSPDGKTLVTIGSYPRKTICVFDADNLKPCYAPLKPLPHQENTFRSFEISRDSRYLATIENGRNNARVWDLATGHVISKPMMHPGSHFGLYSVSFSPDGDRILTGCKDGIVRCWDWKTGTLASPPMAVNDEVFDVRFTPDGRYAISTLRSKGD